MSATNKFNTKTIVVCNQKVLLASKNDADWTPVVCDMHEEESPDDAASRNVSQVTGLKVELFHPTPDAFSVHIRPETQPVFINIEDQIGSKTIDSEVSQMVIEIKSDLEKIREQLQNIE